MIEASGWRAFPPRLPEQPIFYPVTNQAYAAQIARDWNVKESGAGFVTRFAVDTVYLARFGVQKVGGSIHTEYWIPAKELDEFNTHIVGLIEVIETFGGTGAQRTDDPLRIYADFNSGGSPGKGPCWWLRYGMPRKRLDEVAESLRLYNGMSVTLILRRPIGGVRGEGAAGVY